MQVFSSHLSILLQKLHAMVHHINQQASTALRNMTTLSVAGPPLTPPTPTHLTPAPGPQAAAAAATPAAGTQAAAEEASTPSPLPGLQARSSLIDAFFDSDDSWVTDMSPVWATEYCVASEGAKPESGAAASGDGRSPQCSAGQLRTSPALQRLEGEGNKLTPPKRQLALEVPAAVTPKRSRSFDCVDSIVSPVRRNLNI